MREATGTDRPRVGPEAEDVAPGLGPIADMTLDKSFLLLGPQGSGRRISETLQLWDRDTVKLRGPENREAR